MRFLKLILVSLAFCLAVCAQTISPNQPAMPGENLSIEYVANEGVLITAGSTQILLDAVHRQYKPEYAFTPDEILLKIESSRAPYDRIDLILVSHYHSDHFNAESIALHLTNNRNSVIASSDQVIDAVEKSLGDYKIGDNRLRRIKYTEKGVVEAELQGVKIKFLGMLHANSKIESYRQIQNFGHLIEIGGKKLLHIGDADMFADNFSAFDLEAEEIDVVFVPYWFVLSEEGMAILNKGLKAKMVVAIHLPPSDQSETMRKILDARPGTVVFSQAGEKLNF